MNLLEKARNAGRVIAGAFKGKPQSNMAPRDVSYETFGPAREERSERPMENRRPRQCAETELSLARAGKGGYFKVVTSEGEKIVFNVWNSPHEGHVDRRGNRVRRIFPKSYDRDGERVVKIPFVRGEKAPYLPISMLYGRPVDLDRVPPEYRETLELFLEPLARGIAEYNAA